MRNRSVSMKENEAPVLEKPVKKTTRTLADVDAEIGEATALKAAAAADRDQITTRMAQSAVKEDSAGESEYQKLWVREEVHTKRLTALQTERRGVLMNDILVGYKALQKQKDVASKKATEATLALKLVKQQNKDRLAAAEAADQQASAAIHAVQRRLDGYLRQRALESGLTGIEYDSLVATAKGEV